MSSKAEIGNAPDLVPGKQRRSSKNSQRRGRSSFNQATLTACAANAAQGVCRRKPRSDTPPTWFPENSAEAAKIAKDAGGAVLIKPRSQLAQRTQPKGYVVESRRHRVQSIFERYM